MLVFVFVSVCGCVCLCGRLLVCLFSMWVYASVFLWLCVSILLLVLIARMCPQIGCVVPTDWVAKWVQASVTDELRAVETGVGPVEKLYSYLFAEADTLTFGTMDDFRFYSLCGSEDYQLSRCRKICSAPSGPFSAPGGQMASRRHGM